MKNREFVLHSFVRRGLQRILVHVAVVLAKNRLFKLFLPAYSQSVGAYFRFISGNISINRNVTENHFPKRPLLDSCLL